VAELFNLLEAELRLPVAAATGIDCVACQLIKQAFYLKMDGIEDWKRLTHSSH